MKDLIVNEDHVCQYARRILAFIAAGNDKPANELVIRAFDLASQFEAHALTTGHMQYLQLPDLDKLAERLKSDDIVE